MKTRTLSWICRIGLLLSCPMLLAAEGAKSPAAPPAAPPHLARLQWWRDARFGMFIHWGPVSLKGTEIGWSRGAEIPIEEYDTLYQKFNPVQFNADEWVKVAKEAGMKYIVFTTKHHDGFCMFDTKQTDFNIMHSPFARDVMKELSEACRKQGIALGTYHSVCDWHHPDFPRGSPGGSTRKPNPNLERYTEYIRNQVGELIKNYGPLLIMWFDVPQEFDVKRGQMLIDHARSIQPDIIVNNRSGAPGDYDTPEQQVGRFQMDRPWETCMTICQQWAWKPKDDMKSLEQCLRTLVLCAGGDGNLLFNVGPMPDGRIEPRQVARLREMGAWLDKYGETIYGTRGGPFKPTKSFASTRKGNTIFVHVFRWDGDALSLPAIPKRITSSSLLGGGKADVKQTNEGIAIRVPPSDRKEIDTIVKLELDGPALEIAPVALPSSGSKAAASNVFQNMDEFAAESAFDDDPQTRWATDGGTRQAWISVDLLKPKKLTGVRIQEAYAGRVQKFELQYKDGAEWKTIFAGTTLGENYAHEFPAVTAREMRLNILEATEGPTIWEIRFSEAPATAK
jgi:alpha-L-fucosidase